MYRVRWREPGERYLRVSDVFYDVQDAKRLFRELEEQYTLESIELERAKWVRYPSVKWRNSDD